MCFLIPCPASGLLLLELSNNPENDAEHTWEILRVGALRGSLHKWTGSYQMILFHVFPLFLREPQKWIITYWASYRFLQRRAGCGHSTLQREQAARLWALVLFSLLILLSIALWLQLSPTAKHNKEELMCGKSLSFLEDRTKYWMFDILYLRKEGCRIMLSNRVFCDNDNVICAALMVASNHKWLLSTWKCVQYRPDYWNLAIYMRQEWEQTHVGQGCTPDSENWNWGQAGLSQAAASEDKG